MQGCIMMFCPTPVPNSTLSGADSIWVWKLQGRHQFKPISNLEIMCGIQKNTLKQDV